MGTILTSAATGFKMGLPGAYVSPRSRADDNRSAMPERSEKLASARSARVVVVAIRDDIS